MIDIKDVKWIEIFLGYACNLKCWFCYQWDLRYTYNKNINFWDVIELLTDGFHNWKKFVIFSWWEPTLDKNLPKYISIAKKIWYEHIKVHTNWYKFAENNYLIDLFERWLNSVTLSIHWYNEVQDEISLYKWNFRFLFKALINFYRLKEKNNFIVDTNTVIDIKNHDTLLILLKFLNKFWIWRIMYTYPYNIWFDDNKLKDILISYEKLIPYIEELLIFVTENKLTDFVLETIPYCLIKEKNWDNIEKNYKTDKSTYYIDWHKDKKLQYYTWKIKHKDCKKCTKNNHCYWFSEDHVKIFWFPNFKIIK